MAWNPREQITQLPATLICDTRIELSLQHTWQEQTGKPIALLGPEARPHVMRLALLFVSAPKASDLRAL
jgi:hypothetical protein